MTTRPIFLFLHSPTFTTLVVVSVLCCCSLLQETTFFLLSLFPTSKWRGQGNKRKKKTLWLVPREPRERRVRRKLSQRISTAETKKKRFVVLSTFEGSKELESLRVQLHSASTEDNVSAGLSFVRGCESEGERKELKTFCSTFSRSAPIHHDCVRVWKVFSPSLYLLKPP